MSKYIHGNSSGISINSLYAEGGGYGNGISNDGEINIPDYVSACVNADYDGDCCCDGIHGSGNKYGNGGAGGLIYDNLYGYENGYGGGNGYSGGGGNKYGYGTGGDNTYLWRYNLI